MVSGFLSLTMSAIVKCTACLPVSPREDWIQAFVRANFGVAFMPVSIAEAARLAYVRTADCPIVREVGVLVQAERPVTVAQRPVMDSLVAHDWRRGSVFSSLAPRHALV